MSEHLENAEPVNQPRTNVEEARDAAVRVRLAVWKYLSDMQPPGEPEQTLTKAQIRALLAEQDTLLHEEYIRYMAS